MKKEAPIKPHHAGCLCCPGAKEKLAMSTVLYNGFGGWSVFKDGQLFYSGKPNLSFKKYKKLSDIEKEALNDPGADWRAKLDTPLHDEEYQRQEGGWILIKQGEGFA